VKTAGGEIDLNYNSALSIKAFLESRSLGMRKKYGQNFLINGDVRAALASALDAPPGEQVWEIGPGIGAMTAILLEKKLAVRAFEIDRGFVGALKDLFAGEGGFCLVEGDVMKTWGGQPPAPYLLGNLPYNIAAGLLADFIEKGRFFQRMVVTVQKEVAMRMYAKAGSDDYSSFSVLCSLFYTVKPLMLIRGGSFYPRPKVDSMGVLFEKRDPAPVCPPVFFPLLRALFASRRKTLKNNLAAFAAARLGAEKERAEGICARLLATNSLSGGERAETLEPQVFLKLACSFLEEEGKKEKN